MKKAILGALFLFGVALLAARLAPAGDLEQLLKAKTTEETLAEQRGFRGIQFGVPFPSFPGVLERLEDADIQDPIPQIKTCYTRLEDELEMHGKPVQEIRYCFYHGLFYWAQAMSHEFDAEPSREDFYRDLVADICDSFNASPEQVELGYGALRYSCAGSSEGAELSVAVTIAEEEDGKLNLGFLYRLSEHETSQRAAKEFAQKKRSFLGRR